MGFINVKKQAELQGTLFEPEIDALLAVMEEITSKNQDCNLVKGSFIIDGQAYGEAAELIVRGNLAGGGYERQFFRDYSRTSDEMTEDSIDEVLKWPELVMMSEATCRYQRYFQEEFCEFDGKFYPMTGIYRDGELLVLVLNGTYGRFLVSFMAQAEEFSDLAESEAKIKSFTDCPEACEAMLYAISEAISTMMLEDMELRRSITRLLLNREKSSASTDTMMRVVDMFYRSELPALRAWKSWREQINGAGELTLPFE